MEKNKSYEATFESFLSRKYKKQLHLINHPSLTFQLAQMTNYEQLDWKKELEPLIKQNKKYQYGKDKQSVRNFYSSLQTDAAKMLESLLKCFQLKNFALSEFFEYSQRVLNGFVKGLFEQLRIQCKEKAEFIQFIWNIKSSITQKIFKKFKETNYQNQLSSNLEMQSIHNKYSDFLVGKVEKCKKQQQKVMKLQQMISLLVCKLRNQRKQMKKLQKESKKLVLLISQFKDKNLELQNRYMCLVESHKKCAYMDILEFEYRKDKINSLMGQIFTVSNYLCSPSEEQLDQKFNHSDFIKQASEIMEIGTKVSLQEIEAQIDIILDRYEQAGNKSEQNEENNVIFCAPFPQFENQKKNLGFFPQFPLKVQTITCSTQTTYEDKRSNNLIKSIGVYTKQIDVKKIRLSDKQTQCETIELKQNCLKIARTVDLSILTVMDDEYKLIHLENNQQYYEQFLKFLKSKQLQEKIMTATELSISSQKSTNSNGKQLREINYENKKGVKERFSLLQKNIRKVSQLKRKQSKVKEEVIKDDKITKDLKKKRRTFSVLIKSFIQRNETDQKPQLNHLQMQRRGRRKQEGKIQQAEEIKLQQAKDQQMVKKSKHRASSLQSFSSINRKLQSQNKDEFNLNLSVIHESKSTVNQCDSQNKVQEKGKGYIPLFVLKEFLNAVREQEQYLQNSQGQKNNFKSRGEDEELANIGFLPFIFNKVLEAKSQNVAKSSKNNFYCKTGCNTPVENSKKKGSSEDLQKMLFSKLKNNSTKNKKLSFFIKNKNVISIISSTYARSYFKISECRQTLHNFLDPLQQSMKVLYGKIQKQQMNKKIINFVAQVSSNKTDQACKSFTYMLGVDDEDKSCETLTSFEIHLYLILLKKLSLSEKPFDQNTEPITNMTKLYQGLPQIFNEHYLSEELSQKIIKKLREELLETVNKKGENIQHRKLNLAYCSLLIIKQIMNIKDLIKNTFKQFVEVLGKSSESVGRAEVRKMIFLISSNRIQQIKSEARIQSISRKDYSKFDLYQFSTAMLMLTIQNFQQFYIRALMKFGINTTQKRTLYLTSNHHILSRKDCTQQVMDVILLIQAQKKSNQLLQFIIGTQILQIFGLSILIISQI